MNSPEIAGEKPRLLYIVTEDWFFATHFLPIARAARAAGFDIFIVTQVGRSGVELEAEGFTVIPLNVSRSSFGAFGLARTLWRLRQVIAEVQPAVIHAIALKSVVLGGLAARLAGCGSAVFSMTGLGYAWSDDRTLLRIVRFAIRRAVALLAANPRTAFSFENDDDRKEFPFLKRSVVIGGWGIDIDEFRPRPAPSSPPIRLIYFGRMLRAKGIAQTVAAVQLARRTTAVELELWGMPDSGNVTSHTQAELEAFSQVEGVRWCGRADSAASVWERAHVAILLSEREGMPRSLIEAAASGVPMIASDVPGCRSIVRNGLDGVLVPRDDPPAVAAAIVELAENAELRQRMSTAARKGFEERFTLDRVVPRVVQLYFDVV